MKKSRMIFSCILILSLFGVLLYTEPTTSKAFSYDIAVTQTNATGNSVSFKWTASETVDIYINGSIVKSSYKKNSYTYKNTKVAPATKLAVIIVPAGTNKLDGTAYTVKTAPNATSLNKCTYNSESKTITMSWTPDSLICDGYQIQFFDAKTKKSIKTQKIAGGDVASVDVASLPGSKFIKTRIRGFIKLDSKTIYSAFSPFRYFALIKKTKFVKRKQSSVKVSFKKIPNASKYVVKVGTLSDGSDAKVTTTLKAKKTSCVIKKMGSKALEKNTNYYIFITPYFKISKKKQKASDVSVVSEPIILYDYIDEH